MVTSILVVEDSDSVRTLVIDKLKAVNPSGNYLEARDGVEGLKVLGTNRVDLIVCDLMMPNMDGYEFLEHVKKTEEFRETPVIILSVKGESTTKIRMLENGANDYLTKPFNANELIARIEVQLNIKTLQDEMRNANKLLRELSITDHLTHLYNRRYMMDALEAEFGRTVRRNGQLCLVFMDADNFKCVNDTYGHQQGDLVLAAIAEALQVELRSYDIAARYGGEEFAMVLPETSLHDGVTVAERVRRSVQEMTFPPPMERLVMTISIGIAAVPSPAIDSVDQLIKAVDEALYRAKQKGRNRVEVVAVPGQRSMPSLS